MSEVGICGSGVVTKCERGYKETRKDPKSSHKYGIVSPPYTVILYPVNSDSLFGNYYPSI